MTLSHRFAEILAEDGQCFDGAIEVLRQEVAEDLTAGIDSRGLIEDLARINHGVIVLDDADPEPFVPTAEQVMDMIDEPQRSRQMPRIAGAKSYEEVGEVPEGSQLDDCESLEELAVLGIEVPDQPLPYVSDSYTADRGHEAFSPEDWRRQSDICRWVENDEPIVNETGSYQLPGKYAVGDMSEKVIAKMRSRVRNTREDDLEEPFGDRGRAFRRFVGRKTARMRTLRIFNVVCSRGQDSADGEPGELTDLFVDDIGTARVLAASKIVDPDTGLRRPLSACEALPLGIAAVAAFMTPLIVAIMQDRYGPVGLVASVTVSEHLDFGVVVQNEHGQRGLIPHESVSNAGSLANARSFLRSKCPIGAQVQVEIVSKEDDERFIVSLV